jgi:large subunit ribosomal protein L7/L12
MIRLTDNCPNCGAPMQCRYCGASSQPMVAAPPPEAEQTEFKVILTAHGHRIISVIKVVREITGLGLKEAKDAVEGAPRAVKEGISKEDAAKILKQIEDGGGKASVKPM